MADENDTLLSCSFCGKHKSAVKRLVVGQTSSICNECVELCEKLVHTNTEHIEIRDENLHDPRKIKEFLDSYVIGQDEAKIVLSVAVANHYKRIYKPSYDVTIEKGNILLMGPTGSGKTYLAKTVAKYLDVPFVVADATTLTEAGYVGDDVESIIGMLFNASGGSKHMTEQGIVFIDEIDKIARKQAKNTSGRDISGEGVQQALLKLIEGTVCRIPIRMGKKQGNSEVMEINTSNILFIAGGAFSGLSEIIASRKNSASIGFNASVSSKDDSNLKEVTTDDLLSFGMIPEFVGRFTTKVSIDQLSKDDLIHILTKVKNNYILQYKHLFSVDDIQLSFTDEALEMIAENTLSHKTGARGLHEELEKVLMIHMFNLKKYHEQGLRVLNIDKEKVIQPKTLC